MKVRYIINILIIALATLVVACHRASDVPPQRKHVLVLSQMDKDAQIWQNVVTAFSNELADTTRYVLHFEMADDAAYHRILVPEYYHDASPYIEKVLDDQSIKPDLIITLGDALSHSAALSHHPMLSKVPVLCLDVMNPEWKGVIRKHSNFVVMDSKPAVKENMDFIRKLGGKSWIITCIDSTYIDDYLRKSIMDQIGNDTTHYITNLQLETYDKLLVLEMRDTVRSTLIPINLEHNTEANEDTLHNKGFRRQGLLRCKNNICTFLRLKDDAYIDASLGYNLGNYFTGTPVYFNLPLLSALNGCMGGYLAPWPEVARQAHPLIDRLLKGEDPATIPWTHIQKAYWLDWRLAKNIYPYAEDFPRDVHFVNLPWRYESRLNDDIYDRWLPLSIILIVLLSTGIPTYLFFRNRQQGRRLISQGHLARQNRRKVEALLAATNSYAWEVLPDQTVSLGEEFQNIFALSKRIVPLEAVLAMHHQPGRDKLRAAIQDTSCEKTSVEVVATMPYTREDHAFITYVNHLKDEEGNVRCIGFAVNNDEEYQAEKQRKDAYRLSEEINVKESFLAAMSHEIRSPLNAIVGFAEILVKQRHVLTDDDRIAYGKYINDSKDQLLRLLDDVVSYSGQQDDNLKLELSRKSVSKLMDEIYYMHTVIVPRHLKFKYMHGENVQIMTNRSAVLQIMSNLMNNAIKFTETGSITLGWEVEDTTDGRFVMMYVEDTGIGIDEENQKRVFEKYFKTDNYTIGAGLGLPLCRRLATSIKADLDVVSTPGKGAKFYLKVKTV